MGKGNIDLGEQLAISATHDFLPWCVWSQFPKTKAQEGNTVNID